MNTARYIAPDFLGSVELLVLFSPAMQDGSSHPPAEVMHSAASCWVTASVYGRPATSELTGRPCIEDFRIEDGDGEDLEPRLTDGVLERIADYVLSI